MNRSERRRQNKKSKSDQPKPAGGALRRGPPTPSVEIQQLLAAGRQNHSGGNLSKAAEIYSRILSIDPQQPTALYLLGVAFHQAGQHAKAIEFLKKSLAVFPDNPEALNNLGVVFNATGNIAAAEECYRRAIAVRPDYASACKNLGALLASCDKLDAGLEFYRKTISLVPNHAESYKAIGDIYTKQMRYEEALDSYLKARAITPMDADILTSAGLALQYLSRPKEAIKLHSQAINFQPDEKRHWNAFSDCVSNMSLSGTSDGLEASLMKLLETPDTSSIAMVFPIISALRQQPEFARLLDMPESVATDDESFRNDIKLLMDTPLFIRLMTKTPLADLRTERLLTRLRSALLTRACGGINLEDQSLFIAALASQCFINEYVYAIDPDEQENLENLKQQIEKQFTEKQPVLPYQWLLVACYEPLYAVSWKSQISLPANDEDAARVYTIQITEPETELAIRQTIPLLSDIEDETSKNVRAQYEENPYPRWVHAARPTPKSVKDVLGAPPLSLDLGGFKESNPLEILIAGCGTGQHAIQAASRFSNAKATAVDLSLGSISYAIRKSREAGIKNIDYIQGDILELDKIGKQFDIIECGGVLHHMADPLTGWQVLTRLLRDGGLMKIGLYSEKGRPDIVAGREFIEQGGYGSTASEIRRCRQDIVAEAIKGDTQLIQLCMRSDFYSLSPCRDLIFHVQEHRFTIPEIASALDTLGLEFLGFETPTPQPLIQFRQENPGCPPAQQLERWQSFEERFPDTFRGMYQFWCKKPSR